MSKALSRTLAVWLIASAAQAADDYSLVLSGGRVIDPETGLDDIRHVALDGDRIARVSEEPLTGAEVVDVTGLVVAPAS